MSSNHTGCGDNLKKKKKWSQKKKKKEREKEQKRNAAKLLIEIPGKGQEEILFISFFIVK